MIFNNKSLNQSDSQPKYLAKEIDYPKIHHYLNVEINSY